jgi:membrane fusion protein (multidrug efflux system)
MDVEVRPGGEESKDSVRGKVSWIGLDVDRKNDTGFVRIALPAKAGLRPGQFVRIRIVVEEHQDHLVVPRESIIETPEGKSAVMGFLGEKAIRKEVRVGIREGDLVEIEGEEVDEGDVVVTRGAYGLGEESKVRIVKEK